VIYPRVAVLGGTGFLGTAVTVELRRRGLAYVTVSRRPGPEATHRRADIQDAAALREALRGAEVVINLVAASPLLPPGVQGRYYRYHLGGIRRLLSVCREIGVSSLIHVGALGVSKDSPAPYARTKALTEELVDAAPISSVVFSPSILFGTGSELIAVLRRAASFPLVPVPRIAAAFQPVYVEDMARLIVDAGVSALSSSGMETGHWEVAGPDTLTGTEFAELYLEHRGVRRIHIPESAVSAALKGAAALKLPGFPVGLPTMLSMPNTLTGRFPAIRTQRRYEEWVAGTG
jgi:uncharacterized protein YbjT (DUF2867 family)